jgi:outer membrane immunogenic protein
VRKLLLGAVAWAAFVPSAMAADMAVRRVIAPPVFSWTGFYIGGVVGGARQQLTNTYAAPGLPNGFIPTDVAVIDALSSNSFNQTRVTGGAEAGFNIQTGPFVVGGEFDIDYLGFSNGVTTAFATPPAGPVVSSTTANTRWMLTARARLGWAFDRLLVYGTGGVAAVHTTVTETNVYSPAFVAAGTDFSSVSAPQTGWVAGAGLEYAVTDHWTIKGEYLHVGLPSKTAFSGTPSPFFALAAAGVVVNYGHTITNEIDIGRFGLNYKF